MKSKTTTKKKEKIDTEQIKKHIKSPLKTKKKKDKKSNSKQEMFFISSGCTLLDLAISGGVVRGGGIPGGSIVEIYGPSGAGKTALLCEISAAIQNKGGEVTYLDPEARLNKTYTAIYGAEINSECYTQPDTVGEMFTVLKAWEPQNTKVLNLMAADSLAAMTTVLEQETGDKMGMRRAKEFSAGFRVEARRLGEPHKLLVCSNQEKEGGTPGGKAIGYHASIRIRISFDFKGSKIEESKKIHEVTHKKLVGRKSKCTITKSSIDHPYREAPVIIIFDYGIDDIRGNLQYIKDNTKSKSYCVGDQSFGRMKSAIAYVEENKLENLIKETVIDLWEEIEGAFHTPRKKKTR